MRTLFGTESASGGGFAVLEFEFSVKIVRTHRVVVSCPSKERGVETFRGVLVGRVEFDPAEVSGRVLVDVCHSGRSLHQIGMIGYLRTSALRQALGYVATKTFTTEGTGHRGTQKNLTG